MAKTPEELKALPAQVLQMINNGQLAEAEAIWNTLSEGERQYLTAQVKEQRRLQEEQRQIDTQQDLQEDALTQQGENQLTYGLPATLAGTGGGAYLASLWAKPAAETAATTLPEVATSAVGDLALSPTMSFEGALPEAASSLSSPAMPMGGGGGGGLPPVPPTEAPGFLSTMQGMLPPWQVAAPMAIAAIVANYMRGNRPGPKEVARANLTNKLTASGLKPGSGLSEPTAEQNKSASDIAAVLAGEFLGGRGKDKRVAGGGAGFAANALKNQQDSIVPRYQREGSSMIASILAGGKSPSQVLSSLGYDQAKADAALERMRKQKWL